MKIENLERLNELQEIRKHLKLVTESAKIKSIKLDVYCCGDWTANLPIELADQIKAICESKLKEIEREIETL